MYYWHCSTYNFCIIWDSAAYLNNYCIALSRVCASLVCRPPLPTDSLLTLLVAVSDDGEESFQEHFDYGTPVSRRVQPGLVGDNGFVFAGSTNDFT